MKPKIINNLEMYGGKKRTNENEFKHINRCMKTMKSVSKKYKNNSIRWKYKSEKLKEKKHKTNEIMENK